MAEDFEAPMERCGMRLKSAVAVLAKATRGLDGVASDLPRLARVVEMRKLGDVLTGSHAQLCAICA